MNHSLACAYDSSISPSLLARPIRPAFAALPSSLSRSTAEATSPTVALSTISLRPISTPSASLILDTTCVASSECPPRSKKLSVAACTSAPNTSVYIAATISSTRLSASPLPSRLALMISDGSGNALRSSFPLAVIGSFSSLTISLGTIHSGSFSLSLLLTPSSPPPSSISTYPTSLLPLLTSSLTSTTAAFTPSPLLISSSISPNSILCPLTFTCWSILPRYSILPSPLTFARSPVPYILFPLPPLTQSGLYLAAVSSAPFIYPLPTPAPPIHSSPSIPIPPSSPSLLLTYPIVFLITRPIAILSSPSNSSSSLTTSCVTSSEHSVGPYAFTTSTPLLPLIHLLHSPTSNSSPVTTITLITSSLPSRLSFLSSSSTIARSIVGTTSTTVTLSSSTSLISLPGSWLAPSPIICVRAPTSSPATICHTDMSKLCDAVCPITSSLLSLSSSTFASRWLIIPPCSIIAPFGTPVDPDV